jgi:DNA-binding FadR family transcriptional regulator
VRRVLSELETQGLIGREVGRGTFVRGVGAAATRGAFAGSLLARVGTQQVADVVDLPSISRLASPADVMELRLVVEPLVIEMAVGRASQAEIEGMDDLLQRARQATTLEEFEHWDDMLHQSFAAASRNPLWAAVYAMVGAVRLESPWGELKRRTLTDELKKKHFNEHVAIVDAVRSRDAQLARRLMQQHLQHIRQNMFGTR